MNLHPLVTLSIYVESQQWRPALETKANNTGYEIIVVTLMKLPQKRRRGRKKTKKKEERILIYLKNHLKVEVGWSEGSLRRCTPFGKII